MDSFLKWKNHFLIHFFKKFLPEFGEEWFVFEFRWSRFDDSTDFSGDLSESDICDWLCLENIDGRNEREVKTRIVTLDDD